VSSPAGQFLISQGVKPVDFNQYGARRGNHEVMMRGTFGNIRLKNFLTPDKSGDWTLHLPGNKEMRIFDASMQYQKDGVPLVVFAGKEYGTGSSRDWAAKGPALLGIKVAIAESFERIHRSNLIGMGVLPLQFKPGDSVAKLGITGRETFEIEGLQGGLTPGKEVKVTARRDDGKTFSFTTICRIDTDIERQYHLNGGVLNFVLRRILKESEAAKGKK
jgi:aconitate hydratase